MNDILLEILKSVLIIATMIIVRYLVPYIKNKTTEIECKIAESDYKELLDYIEKAVRWAKQTLTDNKEKLDTVLDIVVDYAIKNGYEVSKKELLMLIEAIYETVKKEG